MYIKQVTISGTPEINRPHWLTREINSPKKNDSRILVDCPHALTLFCFLGHRSVILFSNGQSLLPKKKCTLPPLHTDPVHLFDISFHTRVPVFFHITLTSRNDSVTTAVSCQTRTRRTICITLSLLSNRIYRICYTLWRPRCDIGDQCEIDLI